MIGAGGPHARWLLSWLLAGGLGSVPHGPLIGLLVCPDNMAAGFFQSEQSKTETNAEVIVSFIELASEAYAINLLYFVGHTDQS